MNRQNIFNTIANHLMRQRTPASDSDDVSFYYYRTSKGMKKCAIGILIDENVYSKSLENCVVTDYEIEQALLDSGINVQKGDLDFLRRLQKIHDRRPCKFWKSELRSFAHRNKLQTPKCLK